MNSLENSTEEFIKDAEWLGSPIWEPSKTQLVMLAREIDAQPASGALHSQYGLLYRFLIKAKDSEQEPEQDLITRILEEAGV